MSSSRILRGPKVAAVRAWRPGNLAEPPASAIPAPEAVVEVPPPVEVAPPPPQPLPEPEVSLEERMAEELAMLREAAREEGFRAGRTEGLARGAEDAAELRLLVRHLRDLVEDLEQGIATDVLSLALELSKQIVRNSLRVRPDLVLAIIREAAKSFQGLGDNPRLILHPADVALMRGAIAEDTGSDLPWTLIEDASIERGGCKFQTGSTEVDATLETRWRRVVASLGRDDAWLDLNL